MVPPFVTAKIQRSSIEQDQSGKVTCAIEQKTPFDGKAKIELLGLPNGVTTTEKEITSADKEVVFDLTADAKAQPTTNNSLFVKVTVTKDGEPIVQNLGQGGVLRVDPPGGAKKPAGAGVGAGKAEKK